MCFADALLSHLFKEYGFLIGYSLESVSTRPSPFASGSPAHFLIMAPAADRQGYWGTPTSTLDWCEENYVVSFYIAEFCKCNTSYPLSVFACFILVVVVAE